MPVEYEVRDHIAHITIDGRTDGNVFSPDFVYRPLTETIQRLTEDDDAWVAIVQAPEHKKAFSYGGDLQSLSGIKRGDESKARGYGVRSRRYNSYRSDYAGVITGPGQMDCPKPVIFSIFGYCLGAATLMTMTLADLVVASEDATFGLVEEKYGSPMPGLGAGMMPRQLPWRIAMELLLTARMFSAAEALEWGFINRVVPRADLNDTTMELAERIAANPPLHMQANKELAIAMRELPYPAALFQSRLYAQLLRGAPDTGEGFAAFMEKRPPRFKGTWS